MPLTRALAEASAICMRSAPPEMLPARTTEPDSKVSRAAAPEYGSPARYAYQVPDSIPAPNYANRSQRPVQQPTVAPRA